MKTTIQRGKRVLTHGTTLIASIFSLALIIACIVQTIHMSRAIEAIEWLLIAMNILILTIYFVTSIFIQFLCAILIVGTCIVFTLTVSQDFPDYTWFISLCGYFLTIPVIFYSAYNICLRAIKENGTTKKH